MQLFDTHTWQIGAASAGLAVAPAPAAANASSAVRTAGVELVAPDGLLRRRRDLCG